MIHLMRTKNNKHEIYFIFINEEQKKSDKYAENMFLNDKNIRVFCMERLDEKILCKIFLLFDCLNELLRISMVCRQWRKIILGKDFLQKRFIHRREKYLIHHWKFDRISNFAFDSNQKQNSNKYFQTGHLKQDICFLGSCLIFDAHSSITIPLENSQSQRFSISVWVKTKEFYNQ